MKTVETILPAGRILEIKELPDGRQKVIQEVAEEKVSEPNVSTESKSVVLGNHFILIEAESLSLDDEFMKHTPQTRNEERVKALIKEAIDKRVKNFYRPVMDPSFTKDGNICYEKGRRPAVGESNIWWKRVAKSFCPERNSRLGTRLEYSAFLGVLIKYLVADGKSVSWAWNAVCDSSKELGNCWYSKNATKYDFEPTGSRCICGLFYDLANTFKLLAEDDGMVITGCSYEHYTGYIGVCTHFKDSDINSYDNRNSIRDLFDHSVGWLVLS